MSTASPDSLPAPKERFRKKAPRTDRETTSKPEDRRNAGTVSWYGRLLISGMLLVAAGWEIFRLILAAITLD